MNPARSVFSFIPYTSSSSLAIFSRHQEQPAHQEEPAALAGDKEALIIHVDCIIVETGVSEKLNLVFILKSLDVTKTL